MALHIEQAAREAEPGWWQWAVWVAGDADELGGIERVRYVLHPSFPDPVRVVTDRKSGFRLEASGWGGFRLLATIFFQDGRQERLEHDLQLGPAVTGRNGPSRVETAAETGEERPQRSIVPIPRWIQRTAACLAVLAAAGVYLLYVSWPDGSGIVRIAGDTLQFRAGRDSRLLMVAAFAGLAGGTAQALAVLANVTGTRYLHVSWAAWFGLRPLTGAAFAALTYLILRGFLFSAGADPSDVNAAAVALGGALAGAFAGKATSTLDAWFTDLFARGIPGRTARVPHATRAEAYSPSVEAAAGGVAASGKTVPGALLGEYLLLGDYAAEATGGMLVRERRLHEERESLVHEERERRLREERESRLREERESRLREERESLLREERELHGERKNLLHVERQLHGERESLLHGERKNLLHGERELHEERKNLLHVERQLHEERESLLREERENYRQRAQEMEALDMFGLAANQTLDPQEVVSLVARFARTLLRADYAVIQTLEDGELHCPAGVGLLTSPVQSAGDSFAARVIQAGEPVVLGQGGAEVTEEAFPLHHAEGMQVGLGAPLTLFGETYGALVVGYRSPYPVSARDTLLALTLARHAAVAVHHARLHATLADRSEELQRVTEELHRTSRLKDRFVAAMSHELRTPVNGIVGRLNLVLDGISGEVPAAVRTQLEKANASARTLLHLVDEIVTYARLDAGGTAVDLADVQVGDVVADAVAAMKPVAAAKGIALEWRVNDAAAPVRTDPEKMRRILFNLLSNAIWATDAGSVTVTATPVPDASGTPWMDVRVRDTGPGITPDEQERIFLAFEQEAGMRRGTGLGLAVSRALAQHLGGDLRVESDPGKGSTFILRLPLASATPSAAPAPGGIPAPSDAAALLPD